ncbi:hypothetical protein SHKM778_93500 [Streptomyces sp. KM77-8]|uniref:N-acetyltransferase domain-containing protein n=1 Tax=Streptomyces haneummycinicus TaxID=3074435 RepID=A0AAT9I0J8_9ACTN
MAKGRTGLPKQVDAEAPVGQPDLRADTFPCFSAHPPSDAPRSHRLRRLVRGPGWPREEHKWGLLLAAGKGYGIDDPEGGLVTACVVTEYGPRERPALAAIGMVLVAERHARRGVGRRLMRHIVSAMGTTPSPCTRPLGRPLYEELGFKVIGRAEMLRGHFVPAGYRPGSVTTRAATGEDLPAIVRLDEEVFGADRTHRHPPARLLRSVACRRGERTDHRLRGRLAQHGHPCRGPADRS